MNIGFIGFGNIAQAIVSGLMKVKPELKDNIYASSAHYEKCAMNASKYGIKALKSNKEVVDICDMVILCTKPYQVKDVLKELDLSNKILVSVCAGILFDDFMEIVPKDTHLISAIPNTPISVAKGVMVCEDKHSLTTDELNYFQEIFSPIALIEFVRSDLLDIAGSIAGCTPAYTAMYMEALSDAACKHGLTRDVSYRLIAKMVEGTGLMALESGQHPGVLKDKVCSPRGTTIKGVASLEKDGFRGDIINAIDKVMGK